jgi:hypothetical protein
MPYVRIADQLVCFLVGDQRAESKALARSHSLVKLVRHQRDPMSPSAQPDAQAHKGENVTIRANRYEDRMHRAQASPHLLGSHVAMP